ncbi:MAG: ASCH domain-containing protein [Deltaproteobacteria bacterium]|nr:ASCH domain-containing protein [Deltaproteobacteria bacterium]
MKALSIRPPWSTLIVAGIKDVENRNWKTDIRGRIAIHSSKKWDHDGAEYIADKFPELRGFVEVSRHLRGHIVGTAFLVDCVTESSSKWFVGPYGFVFTDPVEFPRDKAPTLRGQLGFFNVSITYEAGSFRHEIGGDYERAAKTKDLL